MEFPCTNGSIMNNTNYCLFAGLERLLYLWLFSKAFEDIGFQIVFVGSEYMAIGNLERKNRET